MTLQKIQIPIKDNKIYEWKLDPRVNIISGNNGLLKTSILKDIHSTVQATKLNQTPKQMFQKEFDTCETPNSLYLTPAIPLYRLIDYIFKFKVDKTSTAIDILIQELLSRFDPSDNEVFLHSLHRFMPTYIPDISIQDQELSFSERYLIYILLAVANTNRKPTILLMDSIGGYLQPQWQKILLKELLTINPNLQIIISTQISNIIEGWKESNPKISLIEINEESH